MNDNAPVTLLDDVWKHSERRRQTSITIGEYGNIRAFGPGLVNGSVDSFLHVFTVEVDRGLWGPTGNNPVSKCSEEYSITPYGKPRTSHMAGYYKQFSHPHKTVEDSGMLTMSKIL